MRRTNATREDSRQLCSAQRRGGRVGLARLDAGPIAVCYSLAPDCESGARIVLSASPPAERLAAMDAEPS